jgi:ribosomal protein S7
MIILDKIINSLIRDGNKQRVESDVLLCLKKIKKESKRSLTFILKKILNNSTLMVELRQPLKRHKKTKYPYFVSYARIKRLSIKNIMKSIIKRSFKTNKRRIFSEMKDILNNKGLTLINKKKLYDESIEVYPIIDKYGKPVSKKRRNLNKF